jgi:hypothetical protein
MAEAAITIMGYINRSIFGSARIVTITTWGHTESHISHGNMVDTAVSRSLIQMTIQTVGGIGTQGYCVNDFLPRAVMTGGAGTYPVGGNIVLSSLNFNPVRHNMTSTAGRAI